MIKKALLIGINYRGKKQCELGGCINDVTAVRELLMSQFNYNIEDIVMLTDDTDAKPTREVILKSLKELVTNVKAGDHLCFYYSGHGTQVKDENNDETSGMDEAIYCLDGRIITDDAILDILTNLNGAHITLFFDCCHSGTMCDLKYNFEYKGKYFCFKRKFDSWIETSKLINGSACMFSGCLDKQTSADASFPKRHQERENNGAFTYMLLLCLKNHHKPQTNRQLLIDLYDQLHVHNFKQTPQFSCSDEALIDSSFFI